MANYPENITTSDTLVYVYNPIESSDAANPFVYDGNTQEIANPQISLGTLLVAPDEMIPAPELFSCTSCTQMFDSKAKLRHHEKIHQLSKPYNCKNCSSSFNRLVRR